MLSGLLVRASPITIRQKSGMNITQISASEPHITNLQRLRDSKHDTQPLPSCPNFHQHLPSTLQIYQRWIQTPLRRPRPNRAATNQVEEAHHKRTQHYHRPLMEYIRHRRVCEEVDMRTNPRPMRPYLGLRLWKRDGYRMLCKINREISSGKSSILIVQW